MSAPDQQSDKSLAGDYQRPSCGLARAKPLRAISHFGHDVDHVGDAGPRNRIALLMGGRGARLGGDNDIASERARDHRTRPHQRYGGATPVDGIDFAIARAGLRLLWPNGAGKTTTS